MPPIQFTPGNKSNAQQIINRIAYKSDYSSCQCRPEVSDTAKKNLIYPQQPANIRISKILTNTTLGGRTRFGDLPTGLANDLIIGNVISFRPLRNKF